MELKIGMIVKSLAGHDAGRFYVITKIEKNRAYIVDGRLRKLEKPKKKNIVHLSGSGKVVNLFEFGTNKSLRGLLRKWNVK